MLSSEFLALLTTEQIANACSSVGRRIKVVDREVIERWRVEDELNQERAHFVDPNRPGE